MQLLPIAKVVPGATNSAKIRPYIAAQANLQRKELATKELLIEANKKKIAFALLQEPYVGGLGRMRDYNGVRIFQNTDQLDGTTKAAIVVLDNDIDVIQHPEHTTPNIVVVTLRTSAWEITVVSFYFEPDPKPIQPYLEQLKKIEQKFGRRLIMGGDANAKSAWWGSAVVDDRGEDVAGALEDMGLQVLNEGSIPTFDTIRGNKTYSSFIDVTACTSDILSLIEGWKVEVGVTSSDHNTILFEINLTKAKGINIARTTRMYNSKKANWGQFHEKMTQLLGENKINKLEIDKINNTTLLEQTVETYVKTIIQACNNSIPKKKANHTLTFAGWTEELIKLNQEVRTKKRRIRCAAPVRKSKVIQEYLKAKEKYEAQYVKSQIDSWKEFCGKQTKEGLWESIYRVIRRTEKRHEDLPLTKDGKTLSQKESAKLLVETFYPEDKEDGDNEDHKRMRAEAKTVNESDHNGTHDPLFTPEELEAAVTSFNPKKAPGSDGLTADICERAIKHCPEAYLSLANKCLELNHFPVIWKEATVVALRKPGKELYTEPKSYRPIGLLPVMGKILEKMLIGRIKWHILPKLSQRQYGFMPQRSTEDALYVLVQHIREKLIQKKIITMISLDIEGAFDSAWWPAIKIRLAEEGCPLNLRRLVDSYLDERTVRLRYAGEEVLKKTNKGCVQGSIGGPILWNLLIDPLLQELERRGDYCQAFADDVVLVVDGDMALEVQSRANAALAHVREWGIKYKLKFAPHKTNAMLLTRKLKFDTPQLSMGGVSIGMVKEIKILGLTLDEKLTFNSHVGNTCRKAIGFYKQLAKTARISWGLHPEIIRSIYTAVVEPIIMYAAGVWAPATNKLCVQKQLNAVQRGFAQKLCRAYRTVSLNSALVLAGILPLDLRIQEAAALYEAKRGVPQPALGDREVERMELYTKIPHPAEHLCLEFLSLVDQQQVDAHNNQDVRIYTDGSKIDGNVGAALSIWSDEAETKYRKLKLPPYCTVYQAELLAICVATREILKSPKCTFGIYSDSRSSLETITNNRALHPLAVETRKNLSDIKSQNKVVSLFWIKAHAGLVGNERADQLAKDAAQKLKRQPDYDQCPVSFVKRQIRLKSLEKWNQRYKSGNTAKVTKLFFPEAVRAFKTVRQIEPTGVLTQILTGHGGFSEYLHRFKCKEDPSCPCEPGSLETVEHILLECPMYGREKYNLEQKLGLKLTSETVSEILLDKNIRDCFIEYCVKIGKSVIARNKTRID